MMLINAITVPAVSVLVLCALGGAGLGLFFFGGLWLTVQRMPGTKQPMVFLTVSMILRLIVLLIGLFFIMDGDVFRLLAAVTGILAARFTLMRTLGKPERTQAADTSHLPGPLQ